LIFFPFGEFAVDERGAAADERDEVRCIDGAPAVLCGHDQLERQSGGLRPRPAGDLGAVRDGGAAPCPVALRADP
jgi:hypothetical protein